MAQFGYDSIKKMQPREGKSYATEYYKQNKDERERTQRHVSTIIERIAAKADENPGGWEVLEKPDRRFPKKESQGYYSPLEIVTDMLEQLVSGKDIPSGILGRWNKLMRGTGCEIDMVPYHSLEVDSKFKELFNAS